MARPSSHGPTSPHVALVATRKTVILTLPRPLPCRAAPPSFPFLPPRRRPHPTLISGLQVGPHWDGVRRLLREYVEVEEEAQRLIETQRQHEVMRLMTDD